jgi:hypothetical protein
MRPGNSACGGSGTRSIRHVDCGIYSIAISERFDALDNVFISNPGINYQVGPKLFGQLQRFVSRVYTHDAEAHGFGKLNSNVTESASGANETYNLA